MDKIIIKEQFSAQYFVKSESNPGAYYLVELKNNQWTCSCPFFEHRQTECKHIRNCQEEL